MDKTRGLSPGWALIVQLVVLGLGGWVTNMALGLVTTAVLASFAFGTGVVMVINMIGTEGSPDEDETHWRRDSVFLLFAGGTMILLSRTPVLSVVFTSFLTVGWAFTIVTLFSRGCLDSLLTEDPEWDLLWAWAWRAALVFAGELLVWAYSGPTFWGHLLGLGLMLVVVWCVELVKAAQENARPASAFGGMAYQL